MKTVNLLPAWYLKLRKQRRQFRLQLCLLGVLLGLMMVWLMFGRSRANELRRQCDRLAEKADHTPDVAADLQRAHAELDALKERKLAYRDLRPPLPMSAVVRQVINDMTPGMALAHVSVEMVPEPIRGAGPDARRVVRFKNVAHITVTGVAPNDLLIAQLISKLSGNPLFSDVSMNYSRTELLRAVMVRRFEIQMRMDVDRLTAAPDAEQAQTPEAPRHEG